MRWNRSITRGEMRGQRKRTAKSRIMGPYCSRGRALSYHWGGRREKRTLEPSRGGTGMELKIASTQLMSTIVPARVTKEGGREAAQKRKRRPNTRAMRRLVRIPAAATRVSPKRLCILYGLYGTGLAQPKMTPPRRKEAMGRIREPKISRWEIGLRDRRPASRGVGSPR